MSLNVENFNSGDKFLLTMTNLERTELFLSKGFKGMTIFKKLEWEMIHEKNDSSKIIFERLGLEYPKNIGIVKLYDIDTRFSRVNFHFILSYKLNETKEITFSYMLTYTPSNRKNDKTCVNFGDRGIELCKMNNKLNEHSPFTYNCEVNDNINLMQNLIAIEEYYSHYQKHFEKFVNAINNDELNESFEFWDAKKILWHFNSSVASFPSSYLDFVDYGIDYNTFIGIQSFIYINYHENKSIIQAALTLMQNGKIDEGIKIINDSLEDFKKNYLFTERKKLEILKRKIEEGKKKIAEYTTNLAKEYGFHESFLTYGWFHNQMPDNLMESVGDNAIRLRERNK